MSRKRILLTTLLLAVAVATVEAVRRHETVLPPSYVTAPVTIGSVASSVTASGAVNPEVIVQVGTYVSGVVTSVSCDFNTKVRRGQLCAKIDPRPYQSIVAQDRANLDAARAQLQKDETSLQYAQLTYQRNLDLTRRGIVPQATEDQSRAAADEARAQVDLDRTTVEQRAAALGAAQINLGYTDIVSPVDGTVVSRNVTTGQTVAASFQTPTLFLIATDLTRMQVDTSVSESDIGGIETGDPASFTVEAFPSRTFEGQVRQVRQAPQTVQNVVTYDVVVSAANPGLLLKPGMTATVHLVTQHRDDVLRVPDQALRYIPGGITATTTALAGRARAAGPTGTSGATSPPSSAHVWVLRQGKPVAVPVVVGLDDDSHAQIVKGDLQPGDRVIVSERGAAGQEARQPGARGSAPRLRF